MYLVDTNVISALAPTKAVRAPVSDWLDAHSDHLFLSAITVMEIEDGIAKAGRLGAARKAEALRLWLEAVIHLYGARILPFDTTAAAAAGRLMDHARSLGLGPGFADLAIAGTAAAGGLVILTRNLRHFTPLGVQALDPFLA